MALMVSYVQMWLKTFKHDGFMKTIKEKNLSQGAKRVIKTWNVVLYVFSIQVPYRCFLTDCWFQKTFAMATLGLAI